MKKLFLCLILWSMTLVSAACAPRAAAPMVAASPVPAPLPAEAPMERMVREEALAEGIGGGEEHVGADTERMIIRTADLSLVVSDTEAALRSVNATVAELGGYIRESSAWREGEQMRARVSLRVPAPALDAALESFKGLAVRVLSENVRGQDVTEEYTDLNAQLTNLEATEQELRELLTEVRKRTQKAEDVLQVYRELTQIRGEIERVKGRMQYLSTLTAMATVNLELIPDVLARPVVEPGWRPLETLKDAGRMLVTTLQGLVNALIWLIVYVLPLLILLAIPIALFVLLIRWLIRRGRARPQA